jgi:dethiobiotin synthetase
MSPICEDATCLDLIAMLAVPVVLVTGTYLGALSHTLTALAALRERAVAVRGIVVSDSANGVGLAETVESLRVFGAADLPIHPLPRLSGGPVEPWRSAPMLTTICEAGDG